MDTTGTDAAIGTAGIDAARLLRDLQGLLKKVEDDLHRREQDDAATAEALRERYAEQVKRERTGLKYADWRDDYLTQVAAAWVISGVFLRYVEDNGWIPHPWIACEPDDEARKGWVEGQYHNYFAAHPAHSDRDYFLHVAREAAGLAGLHDLFAEGVNPIFSPVTISGDMAMALRAFWRETDPDTNRLRRSLVNPSGDTRFLGDLYQDLSESARKKYALLQTPEFVADFLLDRTLDPAIDTFGLDAVRMIDPTCGSGHLLLGAFDRLVHRWQQREPGGNPREHVVKALDAVHGVDLNPFAVAIARFRLVVAALRACEISRLKDAPDLAPHLHLAVGDSLLGGQRFDRSGRESGRQLGLPGESGETVSDLYGTETPATLNAILSRQYHAVVGNPPYVTVKDATLNARYRDRWTTCHRLYSLGVPFTERFFDLAVAGEDGRPAGFLGMITANSFMKREFGKKLVEEFFPTVDLTHVIDTSGAYIPGHGTPTVILFGRNRPPVSSEVRAVLGIQGEPSTPEDPSHGLVWQSIVDYSEGGKGQNEFASVTTMERATFGKHPWSIGGGGATDLKLLIEMNADQLLGELIADIGRTTHTGEDDAFYLSASSLRRLGLANAAVALITGEDVRDWTLSSEAMSLFPYNKETAAQIKVETSSWSRHFWPFRTNLKKRRDYGTYIEERGLRWFDHSMFFPSRYRVPRSISFSFLATHNHFAFDLGGKVFNRHAPVIKLPADASDDDHLALLGLLNSSTACFWMKQLFQDKGNGGIGGGIGDEAWERRYEHDGTKCQLFPVVQSRAKTLNLARHLDELARSVSALGPSELVRRAAQTGAMLECSRCESAALVTRMVSLQEELDWLCYRLYGLLDADDPAVGAPETWEQVPGLSLGERPFEIVLARKVAAGQEQTAWFERHGSTPITEIPAHWPEWYRKVVERRIALIEADANIGLIERPEYKRRWNREPWEKQVERALRGWLLDRLESARYWPCHHDTPDVPPELTSVARLSDRASADPEFLQVAALYRGSEAVDVSALVAELVDAESVPLLPVLRYTESGLRTRAAWRETWRLQQLEDEGQPLADRAGRPLESVPVPPKYTSKDFLKPAYWGLRGKLDVAKERWVSYPGCESPGDPTRVVGWAGWDHLQQATAIAGHFVRLKDEGVPADRLLPLLAGIDELVFWLKLWHNALDPAMGMGLGDYYEEFVKTEAIALGYTDEQVRAWTPPPAEKARRGRKAKG